MSQIPIQETSDATKRFKVALSFPGEYRDYVKKVADHLVAKLGKSAVFYDDYYESELARTDLDIYLMDIYKDQSELIAIFLCDEYEKKRWCRLEWRAIRQTINGRESNAIMPFKFNDFEIKGFFPNDGYVNIKNRQPNVIADMIIDRLNHNGLTSTENPLVSTSFIVASNISQQSGTVNFPTDEANSHPNNGEQYLEYLYNQLIEIYTELNFIPTCILKTIEPFKTNNKEYTAYRGFNLTTNNQALFHFFESITKNENGEIDYTKNEQFFGVSDFKMKLESIFKVLTQNLVFSISYGNIWKSVNTYFVKRDEESSLLSSFYSFEFSTLFGMLKSVQGDLKKSLEIAYLHYQIGNYLVAKDMYDNISLVAKQQHKHVVYFIAQFNLSKLTIFIRNNYWRVASTQNVLKELEDINIKKLSDSLTQFTRNDIFELIASGKFYTQCLDEVNECVNNIVDHYYSQLNGGWSYNNHIRELTNYFAELDSFLDANFIIYNQFTEFTSLFQRVLEGLFASHAISKKQESRLKAFDDYWVSKMILYGRRDSIVSYFKRYKLQELTYLQTSKEKDTFLDVARNFLTNIRITRDNFTNFCEKENQVFFEQCGQIFENIFTVSALLNLESSAVNRITKWLISFIEEEDFVFWYKYEAVDLFIRRKGKQIEMHFLEEIFELTFAKSKLHERGFIESILFQISEKGVLNISTDKLSLFIERCYSECAVCKNIHSNGCLIAIHKAVSSQNKKIISREITKHLDQKFNPDIFYEATLYDTIRYDEKYFNLYVEYCTPKEPRNASGNFLLGTDSYHNDAVDKLANLCFKEGISLIEPRFDKIRAINQYYTWLFDMDNFDYSLFDPEWVLDYQTLYFFRAMRKSKRLIEVLVQYLKSNPHQGIEKVLLKITYYSR